MPIYMNGKKIKGLHYGGRKIKEAWYNGKKVYTSFVIPPSFQNGGYYQPGDVVYEINRYRAPGYIFTYVCIGGGIAAGEEGPELHNETPYNNSQWKFLEKIPVNPYPPENYRGWN